MPHKIQNSCTIRGIEYILSISFSESSTEREIFVLDVMNHMTMQNWRGIFNAELVARLTLKTGSVKAFPAFTAMIKAAILRSSKSVSLDVLTPDILAGKSGKAQSHSSKLSQEVDPRRLYVVLTHRTEFEEFSYPLPLDLREHTPSSSFKTRLLPAPKFVCSAEESDNRNMVFTEFQIEVTHLRKENQKLREALIEERSSRKEFESRHCKERDRLQRHLELQLSMNRTKFQKEFRHISRQSSMLAKNLNSAKRETESLRIQVRRLQTENSVYKRSLTTRPCPTMASRSRTAFPKYSTGSMAKSRLDVRDSKNRSGSKTKVSDGCGYLDRSMSPTYRRPSNLRTGYDFCNPNKNVSGQNSLQRYHSADYLELHRPCPDPEGYHLKRSRSYSSQCIPRKPAFSIIKTLCPNESLFSASRSSSPDPFRRLASQSFIRDSRCSRRENIRSVRRTSQVGSILSSVSSGSIHTRGELSAQRTRKCSVSRSVSPHNQTQSLLQRYRGRTASPAYKEYAISPDRYIRDGSEDRSIGRIRKVDDGFFRKRENTKGTMSGKFASRRLSPVEFVVRKYKEGTSTRAPAETLDPKRRTSLNGAKFRDLLSRLQGLSEEFPETPR